MWPWGHLAVAYLLYSLLVRWRTDRPPRALPVMALAVGSQGPDLIDKPLAWTFGILPGGRTLGHSLFVVVPLLLALSLVARRFDRREVATAFAISYASHLVTDLPPAVFGGEFTDAAYLGWPLLEQPDYEAPASIFEGFLRYATGPSELVQLGLVAVAVLVWVRDGRPGLEFASHIVVRAVARHRIRD